MIHIPRPTNKAATGLLCALFVCAAVMLCAGNIDFIKGKGAALLIGVMFLSAALFVGIRYKMTSFVYAVCLKTDSQSISDAVKDGEFDNIDIRSFSPEMLDFTVDRRVGSRVVRECVLSLSSLIECENLPPSGKMYRKTVGKYKNARFYKYTSQIYPPRASLLVFKDDSRTGDALCVLAVELSDEMRDYLTAIAHLKR